MSNIAIYQFGSTKNTPAGYYNDRDEIERKIDELMLEMITPANKYRHEENKKYILKSYMDNLNIKPVYPEIASIDSILDDIFYYNLEIIQEIANLYVDPDVLYEFYRTTYNEANEEEIATFIDDDIIQYADDLYVQLYYDAELYNLPQYIQHILDEYKLFYEIEQENDLYDDFDYHIFNIEKNDCQIIMFPEIHIDQIIHKTHFFNDNQYENPLNYTIRFK